MLAGFIKGLITVFPQMLILLSVHVNYGQLICSERFLSCVWHQRHFYKRLLCLTGAQKYQGHSGLTDGVGPALWETPKLLFLMQMVRTFIWCSFSSFRCLLITVSFVVVVNQLQLRKTTSVLKLSNNFSILC